MTERYETTNRSILQCRVRLNKKMREILQSTHLLKYIVKVINCKLLLLYTSSGSMIKFLPANNLA